MKIYLDDERGAPPGWVQVKTSAEAVELLQLLQTLPNEAYDEEFEAISLDHDLGINNGTGMNVLNWMLDNNFLPREVLFHSANRPARENMISKYFSYLKIFGPTK